MLGLVRESRVAQYMRHAEDAIAALASNREAWARLAESYQAEIDGLTSVYHDLRNEHLKTLEGDYAELMTNEAIQELKESNNKLAKKFMKIADIINGREEFDSGSIVDSS